MTSPPSVALAPTPESVIRRGYGDPVFHAPRHATVYLIPVPDEEAAHRGAEALAERGQAEVRIASPTPPASK